MTFKKILAILISAVILVTCSAIGFSVSANQTDIMTPSVETAEIVLDGESVTVQVGGEYIYTLSLCAEEMIEDVQLYFEYDNSIIDAVPFSDSEDDCFDERYAPNLMFPVTNVNLEGKIKNNASSVDGFDFSEEKVLFICVFKVLASGRTAIDYRVEEMTILGNESSYFTAGEAVITDGISFAQNFASNEPEETTATEATEATDISDVTDATESATDATEATTDMVDPTEPSETIPGDASSDEETTEPSETTPDEATDDETTAPTETTDVTEPVVDGLLGDANLDGKVNIKDVTLIQKYVANILEFDEVQILLSDTNKDTKVNIKDATAIQKFIAGLIKEF